MVGPANSLNITQPGYVVFDGVSVFTGRTFQAGTGITLTNASGVSGNTTISLAGGSIVNVTIPGAYPYLTLSTDYVILVDTTSARTINLIGSPAAGRTYRIKDNVGSAALNNITIVPNAGTIDGAATLVINSNWGSVDIVYNGTAWRIL